MHRNVVVAISPDTPSTSNNEALIEGIKEWITQGNEKLHTATRERVAIGHVSILIPSSWTYDDAKTTSRTTFEVRKRTECEFKFFRPEASKILLRCNR